MNRYNEISTLQYMGSKTRIISHICEPIIKNKSIKTVVDLFAGTGSVGYALKSHKNIISNDLEYYAYIINHKDDERFCHIFIKGCSGEDYTGFFQTAGYIGQKTTPVCDSEQCRICAEIPKKGILQREACSDRKNTPATM